MSFRVGEVIGDYEIVAVLGAGGMGSVYKVRNLITERTEAMKVLLPNLTDLPELAERFVREIKVQAKLEHRNITGLRTAIRHGNQLLMVMELVDGESLEARVKREAIPPETVLDYCFQILDALEYSHSMGVVHRDLKPANIMVTRTGIAKLTDFGIASASSEQRLTRTGAAMGSLLYMAPEQIMGEAADARSDIYSLGITLYELITRKRPYEGETDYAVMTAHLTQKPVHPGDLNAQLPRTVGDLIMRALAKDPADRFQGSGEFRQALMQAGFVPTVHPPSPAAGTPTRSILQALGSPPGTTAARKSAATAEGQRKSRRIFRTVSACALALLLAIVAGSRFIKSTEAVATSPAPQTPPSGEPPQASPATEHEPETPQTRSSPAASPVRETNRKLETRAADARPAALPPETKPTVPDLPAPTVDVTSARPAPPSVTQPAPILAPAPAPAAPRESRPEPREPQEDRAAAARRQEQAEFDSARSSGDPHQLRTFRERHPNSPLVAHAIAEAERIDRESARRSVLGVLARYVAAFENRDINGVRALRPGLAGGQVRNLEQMFKEVRSIQMAIKPLGDPTFAGSGATLQCSLNQTIVMKNGDRPPAAAHKITVQFRKSGDAWIIDSIE
jgi:serine/threonine-protein kinase